MRLSKLHINGFKSFPDRAELGFDDGVTAIVGPNGCGKSNVVDAITWVLGEQSAKSLRGERMEDVIFNGSDARKPTAAAEVRLRLANVSQMPMTAARPEEWIDDGPIVTRDIEIGRRLYRSGESEYLIDGEVCRLRDIHDLLMDSGLGIKAYAVIEQGKIGQILSSRPAERRMLIEEAAGVTKYKSRRRAAELKLEAARQNLTRIDDIIFEVEKQRGALKRQAARARRYKRLREELRRWEQVQFARRHAALSADIDTADARVAEARAREAAGASQLAALEASLERLRLDLSQAESEASAIRDDAHARELEIGRRQQQIRFDEQQIEDLARRAAELTAELLDLEGRQEPARAALSSGRDATARAEHTLADARHLVDAREAEYQAALTVVQHAEGEADETRAAVLASTSTLSALRQARDNAVAVRDRVAVERSRLEIEARDLQAEIDRARGEHDGAARALAESRETLLALLARQESLDARLGRERADRDARAASLAARQRELAAGDARLRSLEELDARRATFGDAARYLLADASSAVRHHGAVADHLDVERSYERAVDALLGDLLQHVVVDTHGDVDAGLARLAEADAGRCGFLVVEDANALPPAAPVIVPGGARALRDVARAKGPFGAAIDRLLGHALIVESIEHARSLARVVTAPIATRTGEVFRGAGLIEGGARRDVHGILEMRGDIDSLREEVRGLESEVTRLSTEVAAIDAAVATTETERIASLEERHDREKRNVGLEAQAARSADDVQRLTRRLDVVGTERRRADEEEQTAERRREEAVTTIAAYETQQRGAEARFDDVMGRLQAAREAAEAVLRLVTDARTEHATLGERTSGLEAEVARLEGACHELDERLNGRRADVQRTEVRREELRGSVREGTRLLDEDIRVLDRFRARMAEVDDVVNGGRTAFGANEQEIRSSRLGLEGVRSEVMTAEVSRAKAASDLTHLATACLEAVGAPIDAVVTEVARMERDGELATATTRLASMTTPDDEDEGGEPPPAADAAGATHEAAPTHSTADPSAPEALIAELRRKIERLGPVNMMAIEQFDELEGRHTFLTTQRKDLLDSIAQTGEAIRRIDKTTRERFEEAFTMINRHFEQTFTTLFGGGRAGLVLIDQENDPESGIDIIAQPPGKRLQNVQLLSGGEKALTAMALMFAIFKHRPSPFCLLDEIDAPLDDANIGRFIEMLQGMQSHTQFILITHNRKTMEIANRLYGVTMEEPGVSKLISLQLN
jgi:chromosome segregation protein